MKYESKRQVGTGVALNGFNGNGGHEVQGVAISLGAAMDGLWGPKRCACMHERRVPHSRLPVEVRDGIRPQQTMKLCLGSKSPKLAGLDSKILEFTGR